MDIVMQSSGFNAFPEKVNCSREAIILKTLKTHIYNRISWISQLPWLVSKPSIEALDTVYNDRMRTDTD